MTECKLNMFCADINSIENLGISQSKSLPFLQLIKHDIDCATGHQTAYVTEASVIGDITIVDAPDTTPELHCTGVFCGRILKVLPR